jgi:hypothetical protein
LRRAFEPVNRNGKPTKGRAAETRILSHFQSACDAYYRHIDDDHGTIRYFQVFQFDQPGARTGEGPWWQDLGLSWLPAICSEHQRKRDISCLQTKDPVIPAFCLFDLDTERVSIQIAYEKGLVGLDV